MLVLGVHDGHNSSAALVRDGVLLCAIGEERLNLQKHAYGYPSNAIKEVLRVTQVDVSSIDAVAMSSASIPPAYFMTKRNTKMSISDYWKEQTEYWYPKLYQNKNPKYTDIFSYHCNPDEFPYDQT